jgi:tRNA1(Val) A37 N6-methylase TrmN6
MVAMSLDDASNFVKRQTFTRDAFLDGRLIVSQTRHGFRAGLDSVLLGASVGGEARRLLDLGAGAGTAALVAMTHNPELTATLVDSDAQVTALAAVNLQGNGFADRGRTITLDITSTGLERARAGLASDHFDAVIANPPYFDPARGTRATPARTSARQMPPSEFDLWVKTAAAHCAPGGQAIFIYPAEFLPAILQSLDPRFGSITILPMAPQEGMAATRILIRGVKGSRAPLTLLPSRVLHQTGGRGFRPQFEAILRGRGLLIW